MDIKSWSINNACKRRDKKEVIRLLRMDDGDITFNNEGRKALADMIEGKPGRPRKSTALRDQVLMFKYGMTYLSNVGTKYKTKKEAKEAFCVKELGISKDSWEKNGRFIKMHSKYGFIAEIIANIANNRQQ